MVIFGRIVKQRCFYPPNMGVYDYKRQPCKQVGVHCRNPAMGLKSALILIILRMEYYDKNNQFSRT